MSQIRSGSARYGSEGGEGGFVLFIYKPGAEHEVWPSFLLTCRLSQCWFAGWVDLSLNFEQKTRQRGAAKATILSGDPVAFLPSLVDIMRPTISTNGVFWTIPLESKRTKEP